MELFLLRHGHAVPSAPRDEDRALSDIGRQDISDIVTEAKSEMDAIEKVFVSPYLRTQQTLEIVSSILGLKTEQITTTQDLTPGGDPRMLFPLLEKAQSQSTLFVTHQPLVGAFLDYLCGLEPGYHAMGTSALASVEIPVLGPGLGDLRWLKQPR